MRTSVLDIRGLRVSYRTARGTIEAVRGVDLAIPAGKIFGIVGESGSGKSTMALAVMGALAGGADTSGEVYYRGKNLVGGSSGDLRRLWGRRIAIVLQDPGSTLNPVFTVGDQLCEVLREHNQMTRAHARTRMLELFAAVQLPNPARIAGCYPHQISGGQQQRVSIAIALACDPDLLIMDEPTTGLDVTTEVRILDLVESLRQRTSATVLYITHNLGVVARLCDHVAVMYAGEIVEQGGVQEIFAHPRHPYTIALLKCLPRIDRPPTSRFLSAIGGGLPGLGAANDACAFGPRCIDVSDRCRAERPSLVEIAQSRWVRCFHWNRDRTAREEEMRRPEVEPRGPRDAGRPVLGVDNLVHHYGRGGELFGAFRKPSQVRAIDGISVEVGVGETVAVVGESGSGKSTLARCIVGLLQPTGGHVKVAGQAVPRRPSAWPRQLRRKIQIVFQNPDRTLNPRRSVMEAVARPLALFRIASRRTRRAAATRAFEAVGLSESHLDAYPGQLSGGQRQRIAIARAFACRPELVVCDEPTSALDVSVQATVLNLLSELQDRERTSYLFISHDLSVVRHIANRVLVLYLGKICEAGPTESVFAAPWHPYTEALLSAISSFDSVSRRTTRLDGPAPNPAAPPTGCVFHPRCPRKIGPICEHEAPPSVTTDQGHMIACHIPFVDLLRLQSEAKGGLDTDPGSRSEHWAR